MSLAASRIAREAAKDIRKKYPHRSGKATNVTMIAAALGIDIIHGEIKGTFRNNISGLIKINGKDGRPVIALNASESEERKRFTIAHEIGHYILHRSELVHIDSDEVAAFRDSISSSATSIKEIQANQFAAELLMPADEIRDLIDESLKKEKEITETIQIIAKTYLVSSIAATIRISSLLGIGST